MALLARLRRTSPAEWAAKRAFLRVNGLAGATLAPMPGGASERDYSRVLAGERSLVLAQDFGSGRGERLRKAIAAGPLIAGAGVATLELVAAWPSLGLSLQTDLGDRKIGVTEADAAADALARIQRIPGEAVRREVSRDVLDEAYFVRRIARAHAWIKAAKDADRTMLDADVRRAIDVMARATPVAVHSDFQSENLLWNGDRVAVVDIQDLRIGPPQWDVASLAVDPQLGLDAAAFARVLRRFSGSDPAQAALREVCVYRVVDVYGTFLHLGRRWPERYLRWLPRLSETLQRLR